MKRFMWFCLGLVIATALLVNAGCATAPRQNPWDRGQYGETYVHDQTYKSKVGDIGWVPQNKEGHRWNYVAQDKRVLAQCFYQGFKFKGAEAWTGYYYGIKLPLNKSRVANFKLNGLAECVQWVNFYLYGDEYI